MTLGDLLAFPVVYFALPLAWAAMGWSFVLRENRLPSLAMAMGVTMFAAVFLNNNMETVFLDVETTRVITRIGLFVMSVSVSLDWLRGYRGRFRPKRL